jgi:hypothetical protein
MVDVLSVIADLLSIFVSLGKLWSLTGGSRHDA